MDSLLIIIVLLVVVARFWRQIMAITTGVCAMFLGGALVGFITGALTHRYLHERYPEDAEHAGESSEPLDITPRKRKDDPPPCTNPKPLSSPTASTRKGTG